LAYNRNKNPGTLDSIYFVFCKNMASFQIIEKEGVASFCESLKK